MLYLALLTLIPLAALTYGLVRIATSFSSEQRHRIEDEHALFLAEAGIEEGLAALELGGTGSVGSEDAPVFFGDGLFWVRADPVANDLVMLRSAAMYESGRAAVDQLVHRHLGSNSDTAIFSRQALRLEANVLIDSFDSRLGSYASQVSGGVASAGAVVESNSGIRVDSAGEIHGDIHPGVGHGVSSASSADVTGSLQPLESPRTIEEATPPAIASAGNQTLAGAGTFSAGDYAWGALTIDGHPTFVGPARIVVDRLELRPNSSLTLDTTGGPIEIYVLDVLRQASNSAIVCPSQSAKDVTLHYLAPAGSTADLRSNSDFYGRIVAPHATVVVRSNFEIFGAIQADLVVVNANARIHFDSAILDAAAEPLLYAKAAWTRAAFPVAAFRVDRRDPFRLVGVARGDLPLPAEAHEMP